MMHFIFLYLFISMVILSAGVCVTGFAQYARWLAASRAFRYPELVGGTCEMDR